jgi:hypothetical protein
MRDDQRQPPFVKRYAYPGIALGILGGYLLSRSGYVWAFLALVLSILLLVVSAVIAKGEREQRSGGRAR